MISGGRPQGLACWGLMYCTCGAGRGAGWGGGAGEVLMRGEGGCGRPEKMKERPLWWEGSLKVEEQLERWTVEKYE